MGMAYRFYLLLLVVFSAGVVAGPTISILHTNDLHQSLAPLPALAGYAKAYKAEHPATVFIDAGDWFDRGSALCRVTRGEAIYGAMATMGYDMWIVGNHDWAYGGARLGELMERYPVPVLGANLGCTDHPLPTNVLPYLIKELAGLRVGFFGITIDSYGQNPKGRPYIHVLEARESTRRAIAELQAQRADLIVAVTHLGFERMKHEATRACPSDVDLAREFPDIDVIVGAHSHTALAEARVREIHAETGVIVVQAGASGRNMGRLTLEVDSETRRIAGFASELITGDALQPSCPETAAFIAEQYAAHMPNAKQVVAALAAPLERHNAGSWYAEFIRGSSAADLALLPVGAFDKEPKAFPQGEWTVEQLAGYFFDRYLVTMRVTGKDLLAYLQQPARVHRLNPLHDQGRPFSEDAIYCAGFAVHFDPTTKDIRIDLEPDREYTLVTPWLHSWRDLLDGDERGIPPRSRAAAAEPLPGLVHANRRVLAKTSMQHVFDAAASKALDITRKYADIPAEWLAWKEFYEAARAK